MKRKVIQYLMIIGGLITVTAMAITYTNTAFSSGGLNTGGPVILPVNTNGVVSMSGELVQDKVLYGADGIVTLAVTVSAGSVKPELTGNEKSVDMVIVLDRSGSMSGEKIEHAKSAILRLIDKLSDRDRFSIVAYSDGAQRYTGLIPVSPRNRRLIENAVNRIAARGGTNLGAGLNEGLTLLTSADSSGAIKKLMLISDGLANRGIVDVHSLGNMASQAPEHNIDMTTVGVGLDFNEQLMAHIADRGSGNFHFMENPDAFASVFERDYRHTMQTAANNLSFQIPLPLGVTLTDAGGYPITERNGLACFRAGNLLSGQTRKFFLTFKVPTDRTIKYQFKDIRVEYTANGNKQLAFLPGTFHLACVKDQADVMASIHRDEWAEKVIMSDYNQLKEEVSADIKAGKPQAAMEKIETYREAQSTVNQIMRSSRVQQNIEKELVGLGLLVEETFDGEPEAVQAKQKLNSKLLQYEGYQGRRAKQE
ncbi:MAG: VWA domain-containing protein [Desulfobacteraceae bacterium]|nr:VWA domain-containing protein [Desulfobacteraceae bacterium]